MTFGRKVGRSMYRVLEEKTLGYTILVSSLIFFFFYSMNIYFFYTPTHLNAQSQICTHTNTTTKPTVGPSSTTTSTLYATNSVAPIYHHHHPFRTKYHIGFSRCLTIVCHQCQHTMYHHHFVHIAPPLLLESSIIDFVKFTTTTSAYFAPPSIC